MLKAVTIEVAAFAILDTRNSRVGETAFTRIQSRETRQWKAHAPSGVGGCRNPVEAHPPGGDRRDEPVHNAIWLH